MKTFYALDEDMGRRIPGRWTIGYVVDANGEEVLLDCGIPFRGASVNAEVIDGSESLDFCLAMGVPVARTRLAEVIAAEISEDLQRIPLSIEGHCGFEVLNVLRVVNCIDEARSGIRRMTEAELAEDRELGVPGRYRLTGGGVFIDGTRVPEDAHLFRIEGLEDHLVASDRMKDVMERAGCLGARFKLIGERPEGPSKERPKSAAPKPPSSAKVPAKKKARSR